MIIKTYITQSMWQKLTFSGLSSFYNVLLYFFIKKCTYITKRIVSISYLYKTPTHQGLYFKVNMFNETEQTTVHLLL